MYQRRVGRLPDFSYLGTFRYFLTFCTHERREIFLDGAIVDECVTEFLRAAEQRAFDVIVYCMMPDHVFAGRGHR
jgi:REP element-mobilizing transposase RayT